MDKRKLITFDKKLQNMVTLCYHLRTANESGQTEHPMTTMKNLGYKIIDVEGVPIADCVFFKVEEIIEPLPEFLEKSDFEFTF